MSPMSSMSLRCGLPLPAPAPYRPIPIQGLAVPSPLSPPGDYEARYCPSSRYRGLPRVPECQGHSGVIGVHWDKTRFLWVVRLYSNGKSRHVGHYWDLSSAITARYKAEKDRPGADKTQRREGQRNEENG